MTKKYRKIVPDDDFDFFETEKPYEWIDKGDFDIGQTYTGKKCSTYICKVCGGDKFIVGDGHSYYTAIKCPKCGWQRCIHEG